MHGQWDQDLLKTEANFKKRLQELVQRFGFDRIYLARAYLELRDSQREISNDMSELVSKRQFGNKLDQKSPLSFWLSVAVLKVQAIYDLRRLRSALSWWTELFHFDFSSANSELGLVEIQRIQLEKQWKELLSEISQRRKKLLKAKLNLTEVGVFAENKRAIKCLPLRFDSHQELLTNLVRESWWLDQAQLKTNHNGQIKKINQSLNEIVSEAKMMEETARLQMESGLSPAGKISLLESSLDRLYQWTDELKMMRQRPVLHRGFANSLTFRASNISDAYANTGNFVAGTNLPAVPPQIF